MTKQGRSAIALGASFSASLFGGVFAAIFLLMVISVARPIILAFGSSELLLLIMIGLSMVAVLSKGAARLGILAALLGLILGSIGGALTVPVCRFTFEQLYLFDGLKIGVVALGLFAIPEMIDLLESGESISSMRSRAGMWEGFRATLKRPLLVTQSSAIGTALGLLPGLGSMTDWVAYAVAAKTTKNRANSAKAKSMA